MQNNASNGQLIPVSVAGLFLMRYLWMVLNLGLWWKMRLFVVIPNEQKEKILNLDENSLTMDGNYQQHGCLLTVRFCEGSFPVLGLIISKI